MIEGNLTLDKLQAQFPGAVLDAVDCKGDVTITVAVDRLLDICRFLRDDPDLRYDLLSFVTAVDRLNLGIQPRFAAVYNLYSLTYRRRIMLKVPLEGDPPHCPSVTSIWPGADWHERETYDLMGVIFDGHPHLCRIMLPDDWKGHPLRKDYPLGGEPVAFSENADDPALAGLGTQVMDAPSTPPLLPPGWVDDPGMLVVNFGPQHPATHGVMRFVLQLDGEKIVRCWPDPGHLHSGIEKTVEYKTYMQAIPYTDRMDYVSAMNNNLGLILAIEKLLDIEPPPRAQVLRVILCELQRLAAHCIWIGTSCLDLSGTIHALLLYAFQQREYILNIFEMVAGARLTPTYFCVGGVRWDVPEGFVPAVRSFLEGFVKALDEWETMLTNNPIWLSRTKGIGYLPLDKAIAMGVTGPCLRGSGLAYDVRKYAPYAAYDQFEFDIPTQKEGDCYARYLVRVAEMRQSVRIIQQALAKLPAGPVKADDRKVVLPPRPELETSMEALIHHFKLVTEGFNVPAGEVYAAVEAPKGELGFYLVSDGGPRPYRLKIRGPSFSNIAASPIMAEGAWLADMVAIIGSVDITMGEVDR
ncbi:MAG: NADH-quinone oxidoreductase subunit D [Anaerolineae bacterium]